MKKVKKIVVPVDFMKNTDSLVEYASYIAKGLGAKVYFVHVIPNYPEDAMIGAPFAQQYQDEEFKKSTEKMSRLDASSGNVVFGNPVEEIVRFAEEKDADLIILGTHDAKGLEKIFLGNVAEHVLRDASCPVLVMKPTKEK